jgi:hypothetical protein
MLRLIFKTLGKLTVIACLMSLTSCTAGRTYTWNDVNEVVGPTAHNQ